MGGQYVGEYVIFVTVCIELACCLYALFRIDWVKQARNKLARNSAPLYALLPDFKTMVHHKFWCWDINGFLPPNLKGGCDGRRANS